MTLKIHNSMTRQKEEFVPLDPEGKKVSFYNCGPTVYGPFHIGNARNFTVVDVMRRWMNEIGYEVKLVQNITDVDDKIINKANQEGISTEEVTEKYTKLFFEHMRLLGIREADEHPRATKFIGPMIDLVKRLVEKGHAYASEDGSVWFAVRSFDQYGKLSKRNLDDMREGERVSADQQKLKRDPLDFSLWKAAKPGEPAWDSPWGKGRPGWHLECSVMSLSCHGHTETIDIHAGGTDLRFPHHENEIAQCEADTGKEFARYWVHNGFLNIESEKMSKSLGNVAYIDVLLENFEALNLRHFLLSAHYRSELDFTQENLEFTGKAARRYAEASKAALRALGREPKADAWRGHEKAEELYAKFADFMNDDFNTAGAIGAMFEVVTPLNTARAALEKGDKTAEAEVDVYGSLLSHLRELLGLTPDLEKDEENLSGLSEDLMGLIIEVRAEARKAKAWPLADLIRDRLTEIGVTLEDSPQGTTWKMK